LRYIWVERAEMLFVEKISTFYGRMQALKDISIKLEEGEVVCVIGANGAGKTTLLHSICGIMSIKIGRILFNDEPIHRLKPASIVRKGISLVPEGRRIFGPLTVKENLAMGAFIRFGKDRREGVRKDIESIFKTFRILDERQNQLAGELSGGEQQMLAIGRALMSKPKLLLLDEPSMGLAPIVVKEIFKVLERLKKERTTLLLVEQNARIALQLCDRGYVLERGGVVSEGSHEELLRDDGIKKAYLGG
jgi:branched-chain amino acid transport system ATP-binding protein